jgi:hypothetical protein
MPTARYTGPRGAVEAWHAPIRIIDGDMLTLRIRLSAAFDNHAARLSSDGHLNQIVHNSSPFPFVGQAH